MTIQTTVAIGNTLLSIVIFSLTAYAVFVLGHSGWWLVGAVVIDGLLSQRVTAKTDAA